MRAFLSFRQTGATLSCRSQASYCGDFSYFGAWALECLGFGRCGSQALEHRLNSLWHTSLVVFRHVGSSWIRYQTCVSCMAGRFFTTKPPGSPRELIYVERFFFVFFCFFFNKNEIKKTKDGWIQTSLFTSECQPITDFPPRVKGKTGDNL